MRKASNWSKIFPLGVWIWIGGYVFGVFLLSGNFKLAMVFSVFMLGLGVLLLQSVFKSLFVLYLLSAQFSKPAKEYVFILIEKGLYHFDLSPNGIFERYGIQISDVLAMWLVLMMIMLLVKQVVNNGYRQVFRTDVLKRNRVFIVVGASWFIYLVWAFFSSRVNSALPVFSLFVSFQYWKLWITLLAVCCLWNWEKKSKHLIFIAVLSLITTQSVLSLREFVFRLTGSGTAKQVSFVDEVPEEDGLFPRPKGSFDHANDMSFVVFKMLIVLLLLETELPEKFKLFTNLGLIGGGLVLLLGQTRSLWVVVALWVVVERKLNLDLFSKRILPLVRKQSRLLLVLSFPILMIMFPRIVNSRFFFSQKGGGGLRREMIEESWNLIKMKPLSGYGVEATIPAFLEFFPKGYIYRFPFTVHTMYLRLVLESGIIAACWYFLPMIYVFFLSIRNSFSNKNIFLFGLFGIFIYYLIQPSSGRVDYVFMGLTVGIMSIIIDKKMRYVEDR